MAVIFLLLLFFAVGVEAAQALPARVRVELFSTRKDEGSDWIFFKGPAQVVAPKPLSLGPGEYYFEPSTGGIDLVKPDGKGRPVLISGARRIVIRGLGGTISLAPNSVDAPRPYRGTVTLWRNGLDRRLVVVNEVDTRSYITSCVGSESPVGFREEALKAQAVVSTTLLERHYRGKPMVDSTEEQSYLGVAAERPEVKAAVEKVFGQELYYGGKPIDIFFSSTCGGTTAKPEIFGGTVAVGRYPYLHEVKCSFCKASPFFKEHVWDISSMDFLKKSGFVLPVVESEHLGRPSSVAFTKGGHKSVMNGYQFWLLIGQKFGWGVLPSTRYNITLYPDGIKFVSRGCGHGVGLCQWGSQGQAVAGRGYKEILQFYFPGTTLKTSN